MLLTDLHLHSNFSDGKLSISELVDLYGRNGFHAIAIADHLCETKGLVGRVSHHLRFSLSPATFPAYIAEIRRQAERAWREYRMLVIPGYEITKNSFVNSRSAHLVILGIEEYISPDLDVPDILREARAKGALTIAAHRLLRAISNFNLYICGRGERRFLAWSTCGRRPTAAASFRKCSSRGYRFWRPATFTTRDISGPGKQRSGRTRTKPRSSARCAKANKK